MANLAHGSFAYDDGSPMTVRAPPAENDRIVDAEFERNGLPASDPGVDVDPGRWTGPPAGNATARAV
jgi:hypothetical protein